MIKDSNLLKSGIDYPKNWNQFIDWFHNDEACRDYIYKIRWPDGFTCPRCYANKTPYKLKNGSLKCADCRKETSVTASTIFNKTRISLKDWFRYYSLDGYEEVVVGEIPEEVVLEENNPDDFPDQLTIFVDSLEPSFRPNS